MGKITLVKVSSFSTRHICFCLPLITAGSLSSLQALCGAAREQEGKGLLASCNVRFPPATEGPSRTPVWPLLANLLSEHAVSIRACCCRMPDLRVLEGAVKCLNR